jgi:hypothetical protein
MRRLGSAILAVSLFAGCGGVESAPSPESSESPAAESQQPLLTTTDVDVAPECGGLLTFVNTASYPTLDVYLPSNVVTNLVNRRATAPFTSLADVSSVPLVGEARLKDIERGARTLDYIDADCTGIFDGLAVSHDDAAAIVALVNSVSDTELHDILPDAWNGASNLLGLRPFTSVQAISNVAGIGPVGFRNIRNAATLSRPLETLIAQASALPWPDLRGATFARHFDWWDIVVTNQYFRKRGLVCFGLEPNSVPYGATVRSNLADAAEVRERFVSALSVVDANNQLPANVVAEGLANLDARIAGRTFKGCYFSYSDDPWSGHNLAFFIDTQNGFSVLAGTYWSE